ncbi:MAG: efflux RND transporter periplasmic adaptor subunit, partial [Gammaproteobacteria bacterium]|nr:efflux RND transporter periplasmic adaptor subunit [Gammaproteobacteria bacterium]
MKNILTIFCLLAVTAVQAAEVNATLDWANRQIAAFAVHGVVDKVQVVAGDRVKKDQVLAQLDQTIFLQSNRKYQAQVDGIKPRLFDSKQNYDQALELYERTVLSQVELQRAEVQFQGVEAEQVAARAELEIARWQQRHSILVSPCDCIVTSSSFLPGMVINNENQTIASIELADVSVMNAVVILEPSMQLKLKQNVQVNVAGKNYQA